MSMPPEMWMSALVVAVVALPALAAMGLAAWMLVGPTPDERPVRWLTAFTLSAGVAATVALGIAMVATGRHELRVILGDWFGVAGYGFEIGFEVDGLSFAMMLLTTALTGLIGRFSVPYLHREPGFARFFLLLLVFATGMLVLTMAVSLDLLLVGWELVGISSALLIAFFQHRDTPVRAALRVFITYRSCDVGLLIATALMHQAAGSTEIVEATGTIASHGHLASLGETLLPLCLLLAAMGKSAQFPFGSWLPRAMEGPTPSSAIFYGALSVHAGVYLMIRSAPLFAASHLATATLIWVGASTAVGSGLVARVQTDAKSALAFATMTQVGLMMVEVGLGWTTVATVHLIAHAVLRTFQLLRAPSALRDARAIRDAGVVTTSGPSSLPAWFYHLTLERLGLETLHERLIVTPLVSLGQALDRADRRGVELLTGERSRALQPMSVRAPRDEK